MSNLLQYKGHFGTVEFSAADNLLCGEVIGVKGLVSYEGKCLKTLRKDFEGAVDDYLEMCDENKITPQKEYKGKFNVRVSPELHRTLAHYSAQQGQSLNSVVEEAIRQYVIS